MSRARPHAAHPYQHGVQLYGGDVPVTVLVEHRERLHHLLLLSVAMVAGELGVERLEVLEPQPRHARRDVRREDGFKRARGRWRSLRGNGGVVEAEAEPAQRGQQLGGRDDAVAIAVEQVEDAAQALGLEPPLPAAVAGPLALHLRQRPWPS